jgi:hypothetical protein
MIGAVFEAERLSGRRAARKPEPGLWIRIVCNAAKRVRYFDYGSIRLVRAS